MRIKHFDWSKSSAYDTIYTTLGSDHHISELMVTKVATFAILAGKHGRQPF